MQILLALQNSGAKVDLLEAAGNYTLQYSSFLPEFTELLVDVKKVLKFRNTYAHAIYASEGEKLVLYDPAFDAVSERMDRPNVKFIHFQEWARPLNLTELQENYTKAKEVDARINKLIPALVPHIPPSPTAASLYRSKTQFAHNRRASADDDPQPVEAP
jgi:hypothetical protein